jgi:two-component system, cell cycle sensor histidine kinase and response regulator CckA
VQLKDSSERTLRTLILQNDRADAESCVAALQKGGFSIRADVALTRDEFESRLRLVPYDAILSAYQLRDWSGMDALAAVRNSGSDAPFLLISTPLENDLAIECIKLGVSDLISNDRLTRLPMALERALAEKALLHKNNSNGNQSHPAETGIQLLFANNPLPLYVYDLQSFRILQVNDAAVSLYGYSRDEFSHMRIFDLCFNGHSGGSADTQINPAAAPWFSGEWRHQKRDRSIVDVEVTRHLIHFCGRDAGLGVVQDITARKAAESELASRARYQGTLASLSQRALQDPNPDSVFANTARQVTDALQIDLAGIFEWKPGEGLLLLRSGVGWNPSLSGVATINDSQNFLPGFTLSLRESTACEDFQSEERFAAPPLFANHAIRSSAAIIIPGAQYPFGILCVCSREARKFSERELDFLASIAKLLSTIALAQPKHTLSSSDSRYRDLIQNTPIGAFCGNISGKFIEVNPALVRMLGYSSAEELMAQPISAIYENTHDVDLLISQYAESGTIPGVEMPWKRKDGSRLIVRLAGRAVPDATGNPLGLEIIVQDVTQQHELESQLRQSQKFEAIGQLAGRMAHDFNNVIGTIIGWSELGAEQSADHSRLHEYFTKIAEQSNRASGLTRQLLALARRSSLSMQDVQLNRVVTDAMPLITSVLGPNIDVETRLSNLADTVRADSAQIEQVLMNLCVNARDAMPRGGRLIIETMSSPIPHVACLPARRYIQLVVSDTGCGMDAATRDRIFDPFFTTKETGKGNGLGLTTVFGVVTQHEGYVKVESEPGHGSTFRILLPILSESSKAQSIRDRSQQASRPRNETILIAEDHEGVREVARVALERSGYPVVIAGDGLNALEHFRRNPTIALVIMDLVMPRMGGHAAVSQMREARPELPVIFTTGYAAEAISIPGTIPGRDVVLQKPYESSALVRHVRDLLDRSRFHDVLDTISSSVLFRHPEG